MNKRIKKKVWKRDLEIIAIRIRHHQLFHEALEKWDRAMRIHIDSVRKQEGVGRVPERP